MKEMRLILFIILVFSLAACNTQDVSLPVSKQAQNMKTKNMVTIPELINSDITGAPILSQPIQIQGEVDEIIIEKHGYAYPALYDWNKDGKKDLLIGEFKTGKTGSFLQIHINDGSNEQPKYSGRFEYAKDLKGDTITAYFWCCIGFHPRFVDLTGDGIEDLVTGSYNPGIISMWEGTEIGFKPVVIIEQQGFIEKTINGLPFNDSRSLNYWNYTSVNFADYDGDGFYDLFVGGSGGFRVAKNIGNKTHPKFGHRKLLLDVDGNPLITLPQEIIDKRNAEYAGSPSGDVKTYLEPTDWDGDGVLDLLATNSYSHKGQNPIDFYRGVNTPKGIRFENRKPLFHRKDGNPKTLPGSATQVKVEDFNNDGVNDLLVGMSIISVQDYQIVDSIAWTTLDELQLPTVGKDLGAGYGDVKRHKQNCEMYKKFNGDNAAWYYKKPLDKQIEDIYSTRHRGYVYVMYGTKSKTKAKPKLVTQVKDYILPDVYKVKTNVSIVNQTKQAALYIESTKNTDNFRSPYLIKTRFEMEDSWYLYADTKHNIDMGYIPTKVEFELCEGLLLLGELIKPEILNPEGVAKYQGSELVFEQLFSITGDFYNLKKEDKKVKVKVTYQACNQDMCLPPVTVEKTIHF